jgi:hypothetical protein
VSRTGSAVTVAPKQLGLAARECGSDKALLVGRGSVAAPRADDADAGTAVGYAGPACRGQDPSLWDVDHDVHTSLLSRCAKCARAVQICTSCPIRQACGADAVRCRDVATIRGGRALGFTAAGQIAPVPNCGFCGLPVFRGRCARYCSALCTRMRASAVRNAKSATA